MSAVVYSIVFEWAAHGHVHQQPVRLKHVPRAGEVVTLPTGAMSSSFPGAMVFKVDEVQHHIALAEVGVDPAQHITVKLLEV